MRKVCKNIHKQAPTVYIHIHIHTRNPVTKAFCSTSTVPDDGTAGDSCKRSDVRGVADGTGATPYTIAILGALATALCRPPWVRPRSTGWTFGPSDAPATGSGLQAAAARVVQELRSLQLGVSRARSLACAGCGSPIRLRSAMEVADLAILPRQAARDACGDPDLARDAGAGARVA